MTPEQRFLHDVERLDEPVPEQGPSGDWYRLPPVRGVGRMIKIAQFGDKLEVVGYATYND